MFEFERMGWHGFQRLCITVCREVLGQTVEAYPPSNDAGMDGAFTGVWVPTPGVTLHGRFVIQSKFSSRPGHRLTIGELESDVPKVAALVQDGMCDAYVLMTNAGISGRTRMALEKRLREVGVSQLQVLQGEWLEEQVRRHKRLRMLVPQMYGLGDLTQILDARAYSQAKAVLESMREELSKVVVTRSYRFAADALDKHGFVLLIGEPASGKTTIASMLAMASADQWDASVVKLHDPAGLVDHWNPEEPSQFFWIDDAFGSTQYESDLARRWNRVLPQVLAALRGGARIVMTSRDYIYNSARRDLKQDAFPLLNESQVVIDVHDISPEEKQQILYNHMKLGRQPKKFKTAIKGFLRGAAERELFIPETARRLADPMFTKDLHISEYSVSRFVDGQEPILLDILNSLDNDSKSALSMIYMRNGRLESPIQLTDDENSALARMGSDLGRITSALQALSGSMVVCTTTDQTVAWTYKHPTIGDALSEVMRRNPELFNVFLTGTSVERLTQQVTCGDVGIERAVIVPAKFFPGLVERLGAYQSSANYKTNWMSQWGAKRTLYSFLANRCNRAFLELYLARFPALLDAVSSPGLQLAWAPEVSLCCRLFELGLLPEEARRKFVETVSEFAVRGADASVLDMDRVRAMLTTSELDGLRSTLRNELVPRLEDVRRNKQDEYDEEDDSYDHMQYFTDFLEVLQKEFPDDEGVQEVVASERAQCEQWVQDNLREDKSPGPRSLTIGEQDAEQASRRDVFDDVDL